MPTGRHPVDMSQHPVDRGQHPIFLCFGSRQPPLIVTESTEIDTLFSLFATLGTKVSGANRFASCPVFVKRPFKGS